MNTVQSKIFYLKKKVIFPHCSIKVALGSSDTSREITKGEKILAYPIRSIADIILARNHIAVLSEIIEIEQKDERVTLELKGIARVKIIKIFNLNRAEYYLLRENDPDPMPEILDTLRKKAQQLVFLINVNESDKLIRLMNYLFNLSQLADFIANYFILDFKSRYKLLYESDVKKRSKKLIHKLELLIIEITKKKEDKIS